MHQMQSNEVEVASTLGGPRAFRMKLYYCDESGTSHSPKNFSQIVKSDRDGKFRDPWYCLGSLGVPEKKRYDLYHLVLDLKNEYLTSLTQNRFLHEKSLEGELKGSQLFQVIDGKSNTIELPLWRDLTRSKAEELLDKIIQGLINNALGEPFQLVAIEQRVLYRKYFRIALPPAFIALTFLEQHACMDLRLEQEVGAFIIDRGSAIEQQWDVFQFLSARDRISRELPYSVDFDRWLLENPLPTNSSDCAQIQLCDVLIYIASRAIRENNPAWPWFRKIVPLIASNADGSRLGAGLNFYPPESVPSNFVRI
jgi:hypothetical protein